MKKFKNIYLIAIAVITFICIAAGSYMHLGPKAPNKTYGYSNMGEEADYDQDVEKFDAIVLDTDIADVSLEYGDTYHVSYSYPENLNPEIKVTDGTLSIKDKSNFDWTVVGFTKADYHLIITVPEGTTLKSFDCTADVSDITLEHIVSEVLSITADTGDVNISDSTISDLTVTADVGDIDIENSSFSTGTLTVDTGDVDIAGCNFKSAEVTADMGDIDIEGTFDALTAGCDMGDINVNTEQDIDTLKLNLDVGMGDVKINGEKVSGFKN